MARSHRRNRTISILPLPSHGFCKSRKENPQKRTQLSSRSHPRHLVRKRTAQKDITIDTTSDSQVNSNFPNRWSPASLTFNNYFYLFLYLHITRITTNNNAPHLKSPMNQSRRAALGRPAIKDTGGLLSPTLFNIFLERIMSDALEEVGWLVVLGLTAFETIFQSISGRLPKRGRKRRNDR